MEQGEPRGATIAAEARGSNRATLRQVFCHSAQPGNIRDEHRNSLGHVEVLGLILFCPLYYLIVLYYYFVREIVNETLYIIFL